MSVTVSRTAAKRCGRHSFSLFLFLVSLFNERTITQKKRKNNNNNNIAHCGGSAAGYTIGRAPLVAHRWRWWGPTWLLERDGIWRRQVNKEWRSGRVKGGWEQETKATNTHTQNHLLTHTRVCVLYSPENKKNNESKKKQKFSLSLSVQKMKKPDVLFYYLTGKVCHFGRIVSTLPAGLKYLLTLSLLLGLSPFCV